MESNSGASVPTIAQIITSRTVGETISCIQGFVYDVTVSKKMERSYGFITISDRTGTIVCVTPKTIAVGITVCSEILIKKAVLRQVCQSALHSG